MFPSPEEIERLKAMLPSPEEIERMKAMLPSPEEIERMKAMLPSPEEIEKLKTILPSAEELKRQEAMLPPPDKLKDMLGEASVIFDRIQNEAFNIPELVKNTRLWLGDYFAFEDVYKTSYDLLYSQINRNNQKLYVNKNNPFEIDIVNHQNNDILYPLCNQKDVNGLHNLFSSITYSEAIEFISFLSMYPYLAYNNPIGQKILQELEEKSNNGIITISNKILYRGRPWIDSREMDYTISEMWEPPYGTNNTGRFNPIGINYLYMSDTKEIVELELGTFEKNTLMEANLKTEIHLLDISSQECPIYELCNKKKSTSNINPTEYLLPNYIAQCCSFLEKFKNIKIEGIKYKSSFTDQGHCYVFFNKNRDSFNGEKILV